MIIEFYPYIYNAPFHQTLIYKNFLKLPTCEWSKELEVGQSKRVSLRNSCSLKIYKNTYASSFLFCLGTHWFPCSTGNSGNLPTLFSPRALMKTCIPAVHLSCPSHPPWSLSCHFYRPHQPCWYGCLFPVLRCVRSADVGRTVPVPSLSSLGALNRGRIDSWALRSGCTPAARVAPLVGSKTIHQPHWVWKSFPPPVSKRIHRAFVSRQLGTYGHLARIESTNSRFMTKFSWSLL